MNILLLEPFLTGSHAAWAEGYRQHSRHRVQILGLPGRYWKWRMHGGAVTLARQFLQSSERPDLLLATDMLDLATFLALTRERTAELPVALYLHENQLSYPWSPADRDPALQRDAHYCFINYTSALAADALLFNSEYHRGDFLSELPGFLQSFPDCNETETVAQIAKKSSTLPLGLDLRRFDRYRPAAEAQAGRPPLILWNHRWEYDKNPDEFFRALFALQQAGIEFELAVLGESYRKQPPIFAEAQRRLQAQIVHWGYAESFAEYAGWLWRADLLPVTSQHDFFGISVVEAIYCGCMPLLPQRLAYPEHLPAARADCYRDFDEFVARLSDACRNPRPCPPSYAAAVAGYDWQRLAPRYDDLLGSLAFHRKTG